MNKKVKERKSYIYLYMCVYVYVCMYFIFKRLLLFPGFQLFQRLPVLEVL